jgi:hypothetical protein
MSTFRHASPHNTKESEEIQTNEQTSHFVKGTALILSNCSEISQVNNSFQLYKSKQPPFFPKSFLNFKWHSFLMLQVTFMAFSCLSTLKTNESRSIQQTAAERMNAKRKYSQSSI